MLDEMDFKIIGLLKKKGRISWTELGKALNLSSTSSAERVRRLEELGVITGYRATFNQRALGNKIVAFITVTLVRPIEKSTFSQVVKESPLIEECYHIAGEGSYLLKVRCREIEDLETLVNKTLKAIPEVVKTVTIIALTEVKQMA